MKPNETKRNEMKQDYWDYCLASPRCLVDPSQYEAQQFGMPLKGICDHLGATFKQVHSRTRYFLHSRKEKIISDSRQITNKPLSTS